MGFFSGGGQTQETNQRYDNPELRQYTDQYRGNAPWSFMSLDPTATLAAMRSDTTGKYGSATKKMYWKDGKYIGPNAKFKEIQAQADAEEQEREAANAGLERIAERQKSGQFLTSQETEFINTQLDTAFEYAHKTGYEDWQKATAFMAGSRGLRMSDTPAAEPALRELRNFEVGLGSKRAEMGLDATLQFSKNQQDFDANFSAMLKQLGQNRWATRQGFMFGGGMQGASQLGYNMNTKNTTSTNMSGFQKVMAGFQMANAATAFGTNMMMGGMNGTPSSSVGGSEVGASQSGLSNMGSFMGGAGSLMSASDRRLKTNVTRIGTHKTGIGIYSYTIFGQHKIGVMADEVRTVRPEAVVRHKSGYDMVDYAKL